jgi:hypothetical protein
MMIEAYSSGVYEEEFAALARFDPIKDWKTPLSSSCAKRARSP